MEQKRNQKKWALVATCKCGQKVFAQMLLCGGYAHDIHHENVDTMQSVMDKGGKVQCELAKGLVMGLCECPKEPELVQGQLQFENE